MNDSADLSLLQAPDASGGPVEGLAGLAGCWKLGAGSALSLQARHAGVLRIAHGRVWATFDHADRRSSMRAGVLGLAGRAVTRLATAFAISFVAARARCTSPEHSFNAQTCE